MRFVGATSGAGISLLILFCLQLEALSREILEMKTTRPAGATSAQPTSPMFRKMATCPNKTDTPNLCGADDEGIARGAPVAAASAVGRSNGYTSAKDPLRADTSSPVVVTRKNSDTPIECPATVASMHTVAREIAATNESKGVVGPAPVAETVAVTAKGDMSKTFHETMPVANAVRSPEQSADSAVDECIHSNASTPVQGSRPQTPTTTSVTAVEATQNGSRQRHPDEGTKYRNPQTSVGFAASKSISG